jgi:hypothetical protein
MPRAERGTWMTWVSAIGLLLGIGLTVYAVTTFFDRRRTAAFTLAAQQLGFKYQHDGFPFPGSQAPMIRLFSKGSGRRFMHVLNGWTGGRESAVFDYRYFAGRGKRSHTVQQTVAAYRWHSAFDFQLAPVTWGDRVGALLGKKSVRFEDDPEFTEHWHVEGADEAAVRQLFTPAARKYVETNLETLAGDFWHLEANGGWLFLYQAGHRVKGTGIVDFVRTTSNLITGFAQLSGQHQQQSR